MSSLRSFLTGRLRVSRQVKSVITICLLLMAVFLFMSLYSESYFTTRNIGNLIVQCVPVAIASIGQTVVIISGGIDLSIGSTVSLTTAVSAILMNTDSPLQISLACLTVLAMAVAVGLINGAGVNLLNVPPLITTLCFGTVFQGLALMILPVAGGRINRQFAAFVMRKWGVVSMPLFILAAVYILVHYVLYRTGTGVRFYAIGRNRAIAGSMGVRVKSASIQAYVTASLCACVTGLILASRMRIGDPIVGSAYSMDSITAAAIGGTSLSGGTGLISGTVAGAFLVGMLSNAMNILGVNQFYQYVLKGSLLIVAMVVYSVARMVEGRHAGR